MSGPMRPVHQLVSVGVTERGEVVLKINNPDDDEKKDDLGGCLVLAADSARYLVKTLQEAIKWAEAQGDVEKGDRLN